MKINDEKLKKAQQKAMEELQNNENKSQAVINAIEILNEANNANLIAELTMQSSLAESDSQYAEKLGLRVLNEKETGFYEKLVAEQSITADQIDIIPTSIINRTLDDVKNGSGILNLIDFTPADVKRWLVAEKKGTYEWTGIFDGIKETLSAKIEGLNIEVNKLTVALILPKAIRDLALPFVDKYFTAVLNEVMTDGAEYGFLHGTGKDQPIGIYNQTDVTNKDGTHKEKELNVVKNFTPKGLGPVKKYLSKNGIRVVTEMALICNPADEADYVAPAIYDAEGRNISSFKNLKVIQSANNEQGKAIFVLSKKYVMGFTGFKVTEYDQTKAVDDANLIVAKAYGNGRAVDDYVAYPIDVTKLEEYIPTVKVKTIESTVNTQEVEKVEEA